MKGNLDIVGGEAGPKWKRFYCQTQGGRLSCFASEKESLRYGSQPAFEIKLSGAVYGEQNKVPKEQKEFCFSFRIPHAVYFSASTKDELTGWLDAFVEEGTCELNTDIVSVPAPHFFKKTSFSHPVWCHTCFKFLWGLTNQGYECTSCSYVCHDKCKDSVPQDCGPTEREPVTDDQKKSAN